MARTSTLTYRTLRLATIALGLACFHAYAQGAGPGSGRVATVGRSGGSSSSRIATFTSRAGGGKAAVESYRGQRTRGHKPSGSRSAPRSGAAPVLGKKGVAAALARSQRRVAPRKGNEVIVASARGRAAPVPESALQDPVLRAALARPAAPKQGTRRNVFALSTAPTVAELMAQDATGVAAAPRAGGNSH